MIQQHDTITPQTPPFMEAHEIEAIALLLRSFNNPLQAFEWGSGSSTLYYGSRLPFGSFWQSIEHDADWYEQTALKIAQWNPQHMNVKHVPPDRPWLNNGDDGSYEIFRKYVLYPTTLGKKFSVILVDGRARVQCMAVAWELLEDDGVMILHDAERSEYNPGIPEDCHYLRLSAYTSRVGGEVSLLFMAKNIGRLAQLKRKLGRLLPSNVTIISNFTETPASRRILFVNVCYESFLNNLYRSSPALNNQPYYQQKRAIIETCFGDSDYYSSGMEVYGWDADDLIMNCAQVQTSWVLENNIPAQTHLDVLIAQIRHFHPEVLYLQDLSQATESFIAAVRPHVKLIVGQIASPIPPSAHLRGFDIIFSSFPHFVEKFRQLGISAYYLPLAFEPRVLQRLPLTERTIPVSFVGGISPFHGHGLKLLEKISEGISLDVWGYGAQSLPPESALVRRHHGEAWGLHMFSLFASSRMTINRHIDVAENYANNMRLFEATGCGALLLTDYRSNLDTLFNIGEEIVAYRTPEEAVSLAQHYLQNPEKASEIAKAGQKRTITEHNYTKRMDQVSKTLEYHLALTNTQSFC